MSTAVECPICREIDLQAGTVTTLYTPDDLVDHFVYFHDFDEEYYDEEEEELAVEGGTGPAYDTYHYESTQRLQEEEDFPDI